MTDGYIEPYNAVGLVPTMWGVSERADVMALSALASAFSSSAFAFSAFSRPAAIVCCRSRMALINSGQMNL